MKANFDKLNKLTLPATIIIASLILGGFYYASQINKQQSIERQQHKEYIAKRRMECYEIYKDMDQRWNNASHYFYREEDDVCVIKYKDPDWEEGDSIFDKYFTKEY